MSKAAVFDVPYELMPVAAALLSICILSVGQAVVPRLNLLQFPPTSRTSRSSASSSSSSSSLFWVTGLLCFIAYTYAVGRIQGAILKQQHSSFDPYAILQVPPPPTVVPSEVNDESNGKDYIAKVTVAYRELVKTVHPSAGGSREQFDTVVWAYRCLTEESAKINWSRYGHPSGPLLTPVFMLQLPSWLYHVKDHVYGGNPRILICIKLVYAVALLWLVTTLAVVLYRRQQHYQKRKTKPGTDVDDEDNDLATMQNQVLQQDLKYFVGHLRPDLSRMDILLLAASAPGMIQWATADLRRIAKLKQERRQTLQAEAAKQAKSDSNANTESLEAVLEDDDGWAEDNDEDDAGAVIAAKARQAAMEKQKERESLQRATGKAAMLLEGVDDGVLGQNWVMETLASAGKWPPPDMGMLQHTTIDYKDPDQGDKSTKLGPLDHPAMTRVLCMLTGRLNSNMLNTHKQLFEAAVKRMVDQTYFAVGMIFRQRMALLLESIMRLSNTFRSARLLETAVDAVSMFKIGCQHEETQWFQGVMMNQFKCVPSLQIQGGADAVRVVTEGCDDVVTDDVSSVQFIAERTHAKQFEQEKVAALLKQGIPPEIGLQSFREGWWFILRGQRLDGVTPIVPVDRSDPLLMQLQVSDDTLSLFDEDDSKLSGEYLCAYPMIVANVKQAVISVKLAFKAPSVAGRYKFTVSLKSHEFLDCDGEESFEVTILSAAEAGRDPRMVASQANGEQEREEVVVAEAKKDN